MAKRSAQHRLLESKRQNTFASRLRALPEPEAFRRLQQLISIEPYSGLKIANRVLRGKTYLERLLSEGLHHSNESTVRFWIEGLGPRIGARRVVEIVRREGQRDPEIIRRAVYWLPVLIKNEPSARADIDELRNIST